MYRFLVLLFASTLTAAGLPDWLTAPAIVSSTHASAARPAAVIEHHRRLWAGAGLPFATEAQ